MSCEKKKEKPLSTEPKTFAINTWGQNQNNTMINGQWVNSSPLQNYQYAATMQKGDSIIIKVQARCGTNDMDHDAQIEIEDAGIIIYKLRGKCEVSHVFYYR